MADIISWDDAGEIAILLRQRFPETDPLSVHGIELARWVREIPSLIGEPPDGEFDRQLEAIRRAWHLEWREHAA